MARQFTCKFCGTRTNTENKVMGGLNRFCSKICRLKEAQRVVRQAKEKQKLSQAKKRTKKANSISVLKKKLWKIVSEYIRRRDSDINGIGECCTCGIKKPWKELQAGHYIPSGSSSFHRYNDTNIHIQCYGCNCGKGGNLIEYRPFMIKNYGLTHTEWLYETRNNTCDLGIVRIKELIEEYTLKLNNLKEKGKTQK